MEGQEEGTGANCSQCQRFLFYYLIIQTDKHALYALYSSPVLLQGHTYNTWTVCKYIITKHYDITYLNNNYKRMLYLVKGRLGVGTRDITGVDTLLIGGGIGGKQYSDENLFRCLVNIVKCRPIL